MTSVEPDHDDKNNADDAWPWITDPSIQAYPAHPFTDSDSAWILA